MTMQNTLYNIFSYVHGYFYTFVSRVTKHNLPILERYIGTIRQNMVQVIM